MKTATKRRKRASYFDNCVRGWARTTSGKRVRTLTVNRYNEYGTERTFIFRLPNNDKRPMGVHHRGNPLSFNDFIATFPLREWCEIIWESPEYSKEDQ